MGSLDTAAKQTSWSLRNFSEQCPSAKPLFSTYMCNVQAYVHMWRRIRNAQNDMLEDTNPEKYMYIYMRGVAKAKRKKSPHS